MILATSYLRPKVERHGNVTIVTLPGSKVSDTAGITVRELDGPPDGVSEGHLLLDFTNVESLSGFELGTLITLHKRMETSGGRLTLFNLKAHVYEVLSIANLHSFLRICREGLNSPLPVLPLESSSAPGTGTT